MKTMRVMGGVTCRLQESPESRDVEDLERSGLDARTGTVDTGTRADRRASATAAVPKTTHHSIRTKIHT